MKSEAKHKPERVERMRKEAMSGLGIARATDFVREVFSGFQFGQGTEMKGRFTMNAKKILAALAVGGFALTGLSDVTSANIVGYMQNELANGFSIVVSPFAAVGATEDVDIQDLIPVDKDGNICGGSTFQVQTKKPGGGPQDQFIYVLEGESMADPAKNEWLYDDGETPADKKFGVGEAFLFTSTVVGGTLTYKGEVITRALELPLINGFSLMGNPRATPVNIQEMIPVDKDGNVCGGSTFQLQTKKTSGGPQDQFIYVLEGESMADPAKNEWLYDDGETPADKVFQPGEGFLFTSTVTGGKLILQKQNF